MARDCSLRPVYMLRAVPQQIWRITPKHRIRQLQPWLNIERSLVYMSLYNLKIVLIFNIFILDVNDDKVTSNGPSNAMLFRTRRKESWHNVYHIFLLHSIRISFCRPSMYCRLITPRPDSFAIADTLDDICCLWPAKCYNHARHLRFRRYVKITIKMQIMFTHAPYEMKKSYHFCNSGTDNINILINYHLMRFFV